MKKDFSKPKYYRFRLAGDSTKHQCPDCGQKTLTLYMDTEIDEPIDPSHKSGRCDREHKCGYHYPPKAFFYKNPDLKPKPSDKPRRFRVVEDVVSSYIPRQIMLASLGDYMKNALLFFLKNMFGVEKVEELLKMYHVGKLDGWGDDNVVFWMVDALGCVRAGKMMRYDWQTGKRSKTKNESCRVGWVHSMLKIPNFNLDQCFFGEHLLPKHPEKTVFIVESEKTSLIASMCYPEYLWLASGGVNGLSAKRFKALWKRDVILLPDHGMYEKWLEKSKTFYHIGSLQVSDWMEQIRTERSDLKDGFDLADVILSEQIINT